MRCCCWNQSLPGATLTPVRVRSHAATLAVVLLLGTNAFTQDASPPRDLRSGPTKNLANQDKYENDSKGEGTQRIFGIFPAFNVSNKVNAEPLTKRQKFDLFARGTYDPVTIITPAFKVPILQATSEGSSYGDGFKGFAHRYGVALADGTSSRFFRQFLFPAILSEDPRYFRRGKGSSTSRAGYSVSRLFITRTDSGQRRFNWSRLLGSAASSTLSNAYYPESERTVGTTILNFGLSYISEAGANFLKEFALDITSKLSRKKKQDPRGAPPIAVSPLN